MLKPGLTAAATIAAFTFLCLTHQSTYYESTNDQGFYWLQSQNLALDGPYDHFLPGVVDGRVSAMPGYGWTLGLLGTQLANPILHMVTGAFFFLAGRRIVGDWPAVAALIVWEFSSITIVLSRWLLTENQASTLLWVTVYSLLRVREGSKAWMAVGAAASVLFSFTRLEGVLVALVGVLLAYRWHRISVPTLTAGLGLMGAATATLLANGSYAKQNLEVALGTFLGRLGADALDASVWPWAAWSFLYQALSWLAYGYLPLIVLSGFVFWRERNRLQALLPGLTYLFFLLIPPSTTNHPTYMRRAWVFLIPVAMLLSAHWFNQTGNRKRWGVGLAVVLCLPGLLVLGGREDDGSGVVYDLARSVPRGEILVLDEDTNRWAGVVRVAHGPLTVPLGAPLPTGNYTLLRFNESGVPVRWTRLVVEQHRDYITGPMLEGFSPLWEYLLRDVPPRRWTTTTWNLELVRVHGSEDNRSTVDEPSKPVIPAEA